MSLFGGFSIFITLLSLSIGLQFLFSSDAVFSFTMQIHSLVLAGFQHSITLVTTVSLNLLSWDPLALQHATAILDSSACTPIDDHHASSFLIS